MMMNINITEKDFANFDEFFAFVNAFDRLLNLFEDDFDEFDGHADFPEYDDFEDVDDIGEMYPCDLSGTCSGTSCSRYFKCKGKG